MAENYARATGSYKYPGDTQNNASTYGLLYNWATASASGFCPTGWHIPTANDYARLEAAIGYSAFYNLMAKSTLWQGKYSNAGLDTVNFASLPAGGYKPGGNTLEWVDPGEKAYYWISGKKNIRHIPCIVDTWSATDNSYVSVRCVKD